MKNISYKFLTIISLSIILSSCGNSNKETADNTNSNSEELKEEEVMLTEQQFEVLQMKTDTIALRSMSGYVEANGTLEVPPQNEAAKLIPT